MILRYGFLRPFALGIFIEIDEVGLQLGHWYVSAGRP